jgi:hypothetical protein
MRRAKTKRMRCPPYLKLTSSWSGPVRPVCELKLIALSTLSKTYQQLVWSRAASLWTQTDYFAKVWQPTTAKPTANWSGHLHDTTSKVPCRDQQYVAVAGLGPVAMPLPLSIQSNHWSLSRLLFAQILLVTVNGCQVDTGLSVQALPPRRLG